MSCKAKIIGDVRFLDVIQIANKFNFKSVLFPGVLAVKRPR